MKSTAPKLSILVPVYNVAKFLDQCLESILNQTFKDFEIICVNDGSTDSSLQLLQEYAEKDGRIKVINKEKNEGILLARKSAVIRASGEYTVFIDSDDLLSISQSLQTMVELIEHEQVDILHFGFELFDLNGQRVPSWNWYEIYEGRISDGKNIIASLIDGKHNFTLWNKIYRTECVKKAFKKVKDVYFDIAEDCYIYFLIAFHSASFFGIKTLPLYTYRLGSGISTRPEFDLNRFEKFCRENLLIGWLESFFEAEKLSAEDFEFYKDTLRKLSSRFLEQCYWLYRQINDSDKEHAWEMFCKYYACQDIFHLMQGKILNLEADKNTLVHERAQLQAKLLAAERELVALTESCQKNRKFSVGRYIWTKILSKLTFGSMRRKFKEQYKQQKKLYRAIKEGKI